MELDFDKMNGLIPAIVQDNYTQKVLMLGFMNKEAYEKTVETGKVTFFSRTKNRLWTKGEESGNFLDVVSVKADCDNDTLLIMANPQGPVCHKGTDTCWGEKNEQDIMFLKELQDFIDKRHEEMPEKSYTTSLFKAGVNKMAQKVGEEAVETEKLAIQERTFSDGSFSESEGVSFDWMGVSFDWVGVSFTASLFGAFFGCRWPKSG